MIELFGFQQTAAAQVADRYMEYADDPVLAGSARRPRTVPFFQALAALTGAGKTVVLAQAVAQISALTSTPPVVLWLSRGKVVVRQAFANLSYGGRYNHLLGGAAVEALGDYSPATVSDAAGPILYFATVGTFNQRDRSEGSLTIFKSDVDNTETSTWEALKDRKTHSGTRRPLLVVYDEGHNLSDQQTELLLELEPDALLLASATMRLPARLAAEVDLLRRAGWSDEKLVTPVSASEIVSAGLVKSTLLLGGYNSPLEETLEAMLADMGAATAEAAALDLSFTPKAIYVCNTNVVADNAFQTDDPKEPFLRRQAPPILIWRFLTEHHGIDPADIAVYADLKTHSDAPLPDDFVLFKGADNDYENFTAGNYRHIIFNLSLQEGWDDPSVYFAYVDKSMNSRAQVTQVVGRVLRQPDATHYDAPSLNSAHFYVRVDRNETFNEVIKEVSERLGSDVPAIRIISTSPGRQKPIEYMQRVDVSVPRTGINNVRARAAVEEVMQTLPNYVGNERNVEGVGSRRIARQDVGASASRACPVSHRSQRMVAAMMISARK